MSNCAIILSYAGAIKTAPFVFVLIQVPVNYKLINIFSPELNRIKVLSIFLVMLSGVNNKCLLTLVYCIVSPLVSI